jgi:hypothetical protein
VSTSGPLLASAEGDALLDGVVLGVTAAGGYTVVRRLVLGGGLGATTAAVVPASLALTLPGCGA